MSASMQAAMALAVTGWTLFALELWITAMYRKAALERGDLFRDALAAVEDAERENGHLRNRLAAQAMEANRLRRELHRAQSAPPRAGVES
jgi:hypothetical protein